MNIRFVDLNKIYIIYKAEVRFKDFKNLTKELNIRKLKDDVKIYLDPKAYSNNFEKEFCNQQDSNEAIMYIESIGLEKKIPMIISFQINGNNFGMKKSKPIQFILYIKFYIEKEDLDKILNRLETKANKLVIGKTVYAKINQKGELYKEIKHIYNLFEDIFNI